SPGVGVFSWGVCVLLGVFSPGVCVFSWVCSLLGCVCSLLSPLLLSADACELTLDPNTAGRDLSLSEGNRKVTHVDKEQRYPDHPERFDWCNQVLCREGQSGRCYWEAEWSGDGAYIAVAYKSIKRKGTSDDSWFGYNDKIR